MINNDWDEILSDEFKKEYFINLMNFVKNEYETKTIFPAYEDIFSSLKYTSYKDVKVVILGQDPYHNDFQAHGLAFSVKPYVKIPPSLANIYKELSEDVGFKKTNSGYLVNWAKQGVLLLNTVLTVEKGLANSHKNIGWRIFTDAIISQLNERENPIIFLLWGNPAKEKIKLITNKQHYILTAAHPSPLSAFHGFLGCRHFSKTNEILSSIGQSPIDWQIEQSAAGALGAKP